MSEAKTCPQCYTVLEADHRSETLTTICTNCGTRSVSIAVLQRHIVAPSWQRLLRKGNRLGWSKKKLCDKKPCQMRAFGLQTEEGLVEIDICHACEQVWFDHHELEKVAKVFSAPFDQKLSDGIEREVSQIKVENGRAIPQHTVFDFRSSDFGVEVGYKQISKLGRKAGLAYLGFPVEHQNRLRGTPISP